MLIESGSVDGPIGHWIRLRRRELGMTQAQLAAGRYSKSYVSLIESGRAKPSPQALGFFAARLGKPVEYFRRDQTKQETALRSQLAAAQALIRRREFAAAEERLRSAAGLALALDDQLYVARLHDLAGHLFVAAGDLPSGMMAFREAVAVYRSAGAIDPVAAAHCSLANALYLSGDFRAASEEVQAAQDAYTGLEPNHLILARSHLLGGNIASAAGCHETARRCFEQALSLMAGRDVLGMGETHAAIGFHAARRGEWDEARQALERALRILDGVQDSHALSIIIRELSEASYQCGDVARAAEMARRAGSLSASVGDQHGVAWAAVRIAEIALPAGDLQTARSAIYEARRVLEEAPADRWPPQRPDTEGAPETERRLLLARLRRAAAHLAHHDGDADAALTHLRTAVDLVDGRHVGLALLIGLCRETAARLRERGYIDEAVGYYERALEAAEKAHSEDPEAAHAARSFARVPSQLWFRS